MLWPVKETSVVDDLQPQSGISPVPEATASGQGLFGLQAPEERKPAFASLRLRIAAGRFPVARATGTGLPLLRSYSSSCPNVTVICGSILIGQRHFF